MHLRQAAAVALFPICFLALAVAERSFYPALLLAQTALHEAGHIAAALLCRAPIRGMGTRYFGVSLLYDTSRLSYGQELWILLAGAAANLICAVPVLFFFSASPEGTFFAASGISLALFNLLPLRNSDGGRALRLMLLSHRRDGNPSRLPELLSCLSAILIWILAVSAQFLYRANLSLLILSVYLLLEFLLCNTKD